MSFDAVWEYRFYGWCTGVAESAFELRLNWHSSGPLSRSLCRGHGSPVPTRLLRCIWKQLAPFRHPGTSALRSLLGAKQTCCAQVEPYRF